MIHPKSAGRTFYGWYVAAACFLVMAMSVGIVNNSSGVFIKPVCESLGFSRGAMAVNNTIIAASCMAVSLFAGPIYRRFDVRRVMVLSGAFMAAGYFGYSFCRTPPAFYAASAVVGLSEALLSCVAVSMVIGNWFCARRGTAMGIASMGSGIGGMLCNSLAGQAILRFGWQHTYRLLALRMFVCVVPACFFVLRTRPEDVGLRPYGESPQPSGRPPQEAEGRLLAEVRHTARFWLLCIASGILSMSVSSVIQHIAPHISDVGFSDSFAATAAALCMGSLAAGKFLLGWLYDRLGVRGATLLSNLCIALTLAGALAVPFKPALALIVAGAGLGGGFGMVATPLIAQMVYGRRDYGAILGRFSAFACAGSMAAPLFINRAYDRFGSYKPAFAVMLAAVCLSALVYLFLFPRSARIARRP